MIFLPTAIARCVLPALLSFMLIVGTSRAAETISEQEAMR
jgi:hypothetical protein